MPKRCYVVLVWGLVAAVLASCGPTGTEPVATPTPQRGGTSGPAQPTGTEPIPTATIQPGGTSGPAQPAPTTPESQGTAAGCQGRIAFVGRAGDEKDIYVIKADGSGLLNVTNDGGWVDAPAWSPDGDRIAFTRFAGNADVYSIRPDGSGLVRLTELPSREYTPAWSPDGKQVIFGSHGGYASELLVVSAEGGEMVALTDSMAYKPDFAWSPDGAQGGEHIAFTMLDGLNQGDIWVMPASGETGAGGSAATKLTQHPGHDCCVDWAPDGERLLFLSSRDDRAASSSGGGWGGYPATGLLVRAGEGGGLGAAADAVRPVTTVMPERPRDIYAIRRDGSGLTRLTDGAGNRKDAAWSPGGGQIAFVSNRDGNDEIYVLDVSGGVDAGGGSLIRLTDSPADERKPTWSPDGTCLAFEAYDEGTLRLYVMNADGSGLGELASDLVQSTGPSWGP